jgi:hypothetical protein
MLVGASKQGLLAGRPAALCRELGECPSEVASDTTCLVTSPNAGSPPMSVLSLDYCTSDGAQGGPLPGVSLGGVISPGHCVTNDNCLEDARCSFANRTELCTCLNGVDTCTSLGMCVATDCGRCKACIAAAAAFTGLHRASPSSILNGAWPGFCRNTLKLSLELCADAGAVVSSSRNANAGRRPAMICSLVKQCVEDVSSSCLVSATVSGQLVTTDVDLCTQEGVVGGSQVANTLGTSVLGPQQCVTSADCNNPEMMCSLSTNAFEACICSQGLDSCKQVGSCVPTPCKACSNCLHQYRTFATANMYQTNSSIVATNFMAFCSRSRNLSGAPCNATAAVVRGSPSGNSGKRAALVCQQMGQCVPANFDASCVLRNKLLGMETQLVAPTLDLCTLEGLNGGTTLPGISASGHLPPGTCDTDADCTTGFFCSQADTRPLCSCFEGKDACRNIGG